MSPAPLEQEPSDQAPLNQAQAWIDGGARGNPGPAGFGVRFVAADKEQVDICGFLGHATNNVAEYTGALAAMTYALREGVDELQVFSDSQLLVRQVNGQYKVRAKHLRPLFLEIQKLRRKFAKFEIRHVPREENSEADGLANIAIDENTPLPAWFQSARGQLFADAG